MRPARIVILLAVLVSLTALAKAQIEPDEVERLELLRAVESGDVDKVHALLERPGADVNAKTPTGVTALMNATANGHTEIVQALLAAGAKRE